MNYIIHRICLVLLIKIFFEPNSKSQTLKHHPPFQSIPTTCGFQPAPWELSPLRAEWHREGSALDAAGSVQSCAEQTAAQSQPAPRCAVELERLEDDRTQSAYSSGVSAGRY